jgi:hypothetical protein
MPVIINDFEVVVEPKPKGSSQDETQKAERTSALMIPRPENIEQILRRLMQRRARLRAD